MTRSTINPDYAEASASSAHEETCSNPSGEEVNTTPKHEEISSKAGREETNPEPDEKEMSPERNQEKTNTEPEDEKIKPRPDLNEVFKFDGGYRNPPRNRWFSKGTSGNPSGRPPGSKNKPKPLNDKNLTEIVQSEFYKELRVNGGPTVSAARAITRRLVDLAIGGDMRAIKLALTSLRAADAADAAQQEAEYNYTSEYVARLKNDPLRILYDSRRPVPDPEHIILDHINKRALYTGPRNEEEMLKYLAGKDFREETTDEEEEESENVEIADEYPEELRCPPQPYPREPYEDERLRKPTPDEREDARLRKPTS